jgi:protein FrlC
MYSLLKGDNIMASVKREQIAGMNTHYIKYSLDYFLEAQQRADFRSIALWGGVPHFWLDYITYSDCRTIKKKVRDRGLKIVAFTAPACRYQYQFCAQEKDQNEKSYKYFTNGIKVTADLGCKIMTINSGWGYWDEDRETAWKRSEEMIARLVEIARQEGVVLAMETLRHEETQLVVKLEDAKRMFDEINHPSLKIMIDTIAMGVAGETLQQWFDVFGNDIVYTHFVDGTPYGHLIWGDGNYPMDAFIQCLNNNNYTGYLGQEITDTKYFEDPYIADIRNMRNFNRYIQE